MVIQRLDSTYASWGERDKEPYLDCIKHDALAVVVHDPKQVRQLLESGVQATATSLYAAILTYSIESLKLMLEAGTDVNARPLHIVEVESANASSGLPESCPISFWTDRRFWYPIQHAIYPALQTFHNPTIDEAQLMTDLTKQTIDLLVKYGADLFATFLQPLKVKPAKVYPGTLNPEDEDFDEDYIFDVDCITFENQWDISRNDDPPAPGKTPGAFRCVAHVAVEDGALIVPLLVASSVDPNTRDPLGRTLFLAACRSRIGADTMVAGISTTTQLSLFDVFRNLGADVTARDDQGQNALHHLFQASDDSAKPPESTKSLQWLLENVPNLVNSPDNGGTYPLHTSLQQLRQFWDRRIPTIEARPMQRVHMLLDAGADPVVVDVMGNNPLHYALDNLMGWQFGEGEQARLVKRLLDAGVDLHARNKLNQTPLVRLVDIDVMREDVRSVEEDMKVWRLVHDAGARWLDRNPSTGETYAHAVERLNCKSRNSRVEFLRSKGIDTQV